MLKMPHLLDQGSQFTNTFWIIRLLIYSALLLVIAFSDSASAQDNALEDEIGYPEFRLHCAVCHGKSGEGAGSISGLLNATPQQLDLRDISANNAGEYPYRRIFQIIDGQQNVAAHGERMMPIWGARYSVDAEAEYGAYDAKAVVHGRILELVYFLQGIQEMDPE